MFQDIIHKLEEKKSLSKEDWMFLIENQEDSNLVFLKERARKIREQIYGRDVYIRGLIEVSNYCKNDCYYCGIRRGNTNAERYRLSKEQILLCAARGYELGFRTFVMQGGEDPFYTDDIMCDIISSLKQSYPDCAITLSLGEKSYDTYKSFYDAGADRYLLRHETANEEHYKKLHPKELTLEKRKECLYALKEIGFQVGSGFMVGSPYQTVENLAEDMMFLADLQPHMVGIGPFIPHHSSIFHSEMSGSVDLTCHLISLIRLLLPHALIPATTALVTLDKEGWEKGMLAGANVIMPNLSPKEARSNYLLYDNKFFAGDEVSESLEIIKKRMSAINYNVVETRGDFKK